MKGVLRRGVAALCALFLVLGTAACQQKEPKMKDGKILLTVCMESSVGLPNAEKGTTMENSIQSIAQYYTASVNPDVTFEFVTLTADQEERSNRIDQLQTEMMAGQGPDIFILPCDDGFGFNETRLIENVEKGMGTGLFADLSQLYDQDETLEKDLLLEKVMDAGMMDGKRYILPLRYQYPIILALEDELQGAGLEISELAQNSETFLSTVIAQEGNAWHVSGANVFAANLSNVFPSLCDYNTGEVYLDEETLTDMNNNFENMNFPRLSVAAVVFFAMLFCLYTLLLKSPLGRGEPAFESSGRRPFKMSKGATLFLALAALLFLLPVAFTIGCSFLSPQEVQRVFGPLLGEGSAAVVGGLPQGFSLMGYYEVFFATPDYLVKFWLSLLLAVGAVVGQVVISCMGGFAFAFYDFPGKRLLFGLLCFFMLVPLQVTLLPNYLLLDAFGLLNTYWALLLPLAFAPLGTFLLTQIFRSVPADILQAARLDGAGTLQVMVKVLLPCGKSGVSTLIILTLIESWNMVEQPLIYLKDVGSYPLSVFLASRYTENLPLQFVCCVLSLLPLALCFFYCGGDVLDSGIPKEEKA